MFASCLNCGTTIASDALREDVRNRLNLMSEEGLTRENINRYVSELAEAVDDDRSRHFRAHRSEKADRENALHEAAHAVVGVANGLTVKQVNVDGAVCCHFELRQIDPLADAIVSLAGPAVEQRYQNPRTIPVRSLRTCAQMVRNDGKNACDYCQAMRRIAAAHPHATDDERLEILEGLQDRALGAVRQHSDAIDRVAEALVERGHLSGEEIATLVDFAVDGLFLPVGNSERGGAGFPTAGVASPLLQGPVDNNASHTGASHGT